MGSVWWGIKWWLMNLLACCSSNRSSISFLYWALGLMLRGCVKQVQYDLLFSPLLTPVTWRISPCNRGNIRGAQRQRARLIRRKMRNVREVAAGTDPLSFRLSITLTTEVGRMQKLDKVREEKRKWQTNFNFQKGASQQLCCSRRGAGVWAVLWLRAIVPSLAHVAAVLSLRMSFLLCWNSSGPPVSSG